MYIAKLSLWNFRKFGIPEYTIDINSPHLEVEFKPIMNVLIGENDSGKTAIIDAIKYVLKTHAYEKIWITDNDFYEGSSEFRIEITIKGFTDLEASHFTEWLSWENVTSNGQTTNLPFLRLIFKAHRRENGIWPSPISAGSTIDGSMLDPDAREYLKVTYLKPLRDAEDEMTAKKASRLSQILSGHDLFRKDQATPHRFEEIVKTANNDIENWFIDTAPNTNGKTNKEQIKDIVDGFLKSFISPSSEANLSLANPDLKNILEKLSLQIISQTNPGLGSENRLYMAAELLHLSKDNTLGMRSCLIEELEAHLHPQAQMKVIEALEKEENVQFIITTHSPNLASKINISQDKTTNVILCKNSKAYSLYPGKTQLQKKDYWHLQHFLDVTKSNMFFAKGVMMVEGWAEAILIPAIARAMEKDLTLSEVSIVNIGSTAYLHFANIYMPTDRVMDMPVAIITDLDIRPDENGKFSMDAENAKRQEITSKIDTKYYNNIQINIAYQWTLEWCLFNSPTYREAFMAAVSAVHSDTAEFKKDEGGNWVNENNFKFKLIKKLTNKSLKKVAIAYNLANWITENAVAPLNDDPYIEYIVSSINHVCK